MMPHLPEPARPGSRDWAGWLRAAGVVLLCTLVSGLLPGRSDLADLIMVYLAGVAWVAVRERLAVSLATVCASVFVFDLVFVPPRWGLNPVDKSHFVTFAIMLAVGLLISRLADQVRRQRMLAEGRARSAAALAQLAEGLAAAPTREGVAQCVTAAVHQTFGVRGRLVEGDGVCDPGAAQRPVQGASGRLATLCLDLPESALGPEQRDLLAAFAHQAASALDRCAFEERSMAAQVEAETERLRSTLLSGISHDFRTPLTTIVGAATSLLEQERRLDEHRRQLLATGIRDEAQRLHRLVSDLLELTRLEEGAVQPACEWCPADDLVQESLAALGARAEGHRFDVDVPPEAIVWCDARLVQQALANMIDNAVLHTPAATRVRICVHAAPAQWQLVVADDGPGLPAGAAEDLFRKFHRGGGAHGGGTGLGLAICAAVARVHGGRIEAASDAGARFTMTFPQPAQPALEAE